METDIEGLLTLTRLGFSRIFFPTLEFTLKGKSNNTKSCRDES